MSGEEKAPPKPPVPGFVFGAVGNLDKGLVTVALQINTVEGLKSFLDHVVRPRALELGFDVDLVAQPVPVEGPKAL
ncbi:MAG: hypothetical protein ACREB9_05795 [Thermoplasmata archaeon]